MPSCHQIPHYRYAFHTTFYIVGFAVCWGLIWGLASYVNQKQPFKDLFNAAHPSSVLEIPQLFVYNTPVTKPAHGVTFHDGDRYMLGVGKADITGLEHS